MRGVGEGFFERDLTGERGEVSVAHFYLHGVGGEAALLQLCGDFVGLFVEAFAQDGAVGGVLQERVFAADAFDVVAEIQRARIFADRKAL